jgi:hypothetical protein
MMVVFVPKGLYFLLFKVVKQRNYIIRVRDLFGESLYFRRKIKQIWACPSLRSGRHLTGFASLGASHASPLQAAHAKTLAIRAKIKRHKKIFFKKNKNNLQNKKHVVYLHCI